MAFSKLLKRSTFSTPILMSSSQPAQASDPSHSPMIIPSAPTMLLHQANPKMKKALPRPLPLAVFTKTKAKLVLTSEGLGDPWVVEEDEEAIYTKCDMPGISKSGLKLVVKKCSEGVSEVSFNGEELDRDPSFYKASEKQRKVEGSIIVVHENLNMDGVRSHFNNGVLRVVFPKLKKVC